jgi:hypothetical protein
MNNNPFIPEHFISRATEFQQICNLLLQDRDFVLVGVPGTGRRTLLREAATAVNARILEIDCVRSTNAKQFLRIFANRISECFAAPEEIKLIQMWSMDHPLTIEISPNRRAQMVWHFSAGKEWQLLEALLTLPQFLSEKLACRVVIMFQNFSHIRSWDRQGKWETYLRQAIEHYTRVSYALVSPVAEPWIDESNLEIIHLLPLKDAAIQQWFVETMKTKGLDLSTEDEAIPLFLSYVQGHLGDAIALAQRIWLDHQAYSQSDNTIYAHHIHRSMSALAEDMSVTFETLLSLLPSSQIRLLESLALDPTERPQSREYITKHQLSRGGGVQGALNSLEQKGLIYGAHYSYRMALPFLQFWLKLRLREYEWDSFFV